MFLGKPDKLHLAGEGSPPNKLNALPTGRSNLYDFVHRMLSACFVHLYFNPKLNNPATCLVMDSTVAHSTSIYIYMRCMCSYFAKKEVVVRANQTSRGDDRKAYRRLGFRHAEINWTTTREKVSKFIINSPSCISLLGGQSSSVSHTQSGYS